MKSIAYIVSNINKAIAFEWIASNLDASRYRICFILLNPGNSELEDFCNAHNIICHTVKYRSKKDIPAAILKTYTLLKHHKINAVHCHLVDAGLVGLAAARMANIRKRIYTRHHSTFHHNYFPKGIKYDKWINRNATHIVAISQVVYGVLTQKEKVKPRKITLVHHGFDLNAFAHPPQQDIDALKAKYGTGTYAPVIGVISRYLELKGIQYIIPAFARLRQTYPQAHLVLANGTGNYSAEIKKLLQALPPGSYTEIPFENNNFALYHLFDVFVHVPVDAQIEAFGQIYVEALAAGIPGVFTLSGVANEFCVDNQNCKIAAYKSADAIYQGITALLDNKELAAHVQKNGYLSVEKMFSLDLMIKRLEELYA